MASWWTEMWAIGSGPLRVYCGIARTEDGFAVDVFRGDTCIDSREFDTREAAVRAALDLERRHSRRLPDVPTPVTLGGAASARRRALAN